jgi:hypothetical protein
MASSATKPMPTCQGVTAIGRTILNPIASTRPAAAAETAVQALRTASICANCA